MKSLRKWYILIKYHGVLYAKSKIQRTRKNVSLVTNTGINLMYYGAGFLALCWGASRLLRGQMSFGSLTALIQLVNQIQTPFVNLSGVLPQYIAMLASAERLMELEEIQGEPAPAAVCLGGAVSWGPGPSG